MRRFSVPLAVLLAAHIAPASNLLGPEMYKVFRDKRDSCIKVVLKP
jgi:threonine dehydrogenase-like Zn-dependent dehydrogenase